MTQRVHVLRKSFGPYSAGTPVQVDTGTILGKQQLTRYHIKDLTIPADLVVQRRQRTFVIGS